jgi:hypothetical protein
MRYLKWIGLLAVVVLIISCFLPWLYIAILNVSITGMDTTGTNYGKPGYLHIIFSILFIAFTLIQRLWAKRSNILVVALNIAWAVRNYFILSTCQAGECPDRKIGIYLMLIASMIMLVSALFPDMKVSTKDRN